MAHPVDVGQISEAVIVAELVRLGHPVLLPYGTNRRYDLVVDVAGRFVRFQCKTGRSRHGAVVFRPCSTRSNTRGSQHRSYRGECDVFAVFCPDNDTAYAVDVEAAGTRACSLRVDPPANGMVRGIRWARDHLLADWTPPE